MDDTSAAALKRHSFLSSLNFYIRSSLKEAKRRRLYFFLAVCSTLIVVCSTAISQTIIDYAPLIFLKTSESKSASIDVSIIPSYLLVTTNDGISSRLENKRLLFNTTKIRQRVDPIYPETTTARSSTTGLIMIPGRGEYCTENTIPPYEKCKKTTGRLVLQETKREIDLGMGNKLPLPDEIQEGSVIISDKQAKALGVRVGDTVVAQLDVKELLIETIIKFNFGQTQENRINTQNILSSTIYVPFRIERIVNSLIGKFTDEEFTDTFLVEYKHFFKSMAKHLPDNLAEQNIVNKYKLFLENETPQDYADQVIFNLRNRQQVYLDPNFDNIQTSVTKFASRISKELGVFPFEMDMPTYDHLWPMRFGSLFLGVSLKVIIAVLFVLSIIVIYNLLLVTVETKTFEFGVIRMLGLNKFGVAELILIQALFFVAPGLIFGILSSIPLLGKIGAFLESKLQAEIPAFPTPSAIYWSVVVGLLIPIISSYYPMKEALGKNLNLSLDLLRSKTNAIQVSIEYELNKFPWTRVVFAILSVAFGLSLYLFLPLSLLTFDLGLLLSMFFMIVLGMFLGLALLSLNFQYIVEKFVTQLFFFWTGSSFRTLILKNLVAHKVRNRQTSLMYSLSLGFIIFITVSLNQEIHNIAYQIQAFRGSLLQVVDTWNLNKQILEEHIHENMGDIVDTYAWVTDDLNGFMGSKGYKGISISHRGRLYNMPGRIFGVSPTIFNATLRQFLKVNKMDEESALDLGEQLYTARGSQSVILGEYYRDLLGLSLDSNSTLMVTMAKGVETRTEELRVLATMEFAPGFRFSHIPLVRNQDVIISLPTYMRLAGDEVRRFEDLPVKKMFIKVKDDSPTNLDKAYQSLSQFRDQRYPGLRIWDFQDVQSSLDSSQIAISIIFVSVEVIVMVLSLFSLITSMSTNILEQSKEIAILRAVGVTKKTMNRLFVAEGFVLVFSSSLFGVMIGTMIGWTISIQRILFTQLPAAFGFPYKDLIVIFITAAASAALSSYYPARRITEMQIGKIIRQGA